MVAPLPQWQPPCIARIHPRVCALSMQPYRYRLDLSPATRVYAIISHKLSRYARARVNSSSPAIAISTVIKNNNSRLPRQNGLRLCSRNYRPIVRDTLKYEMNVSWTTCINHNVLLSRNIWRIVQRIKYVGKKTGTRITRPQGRG